MSRHFFAVTHNGLYVGRRGSANTFMVSTSVLNCKGPSSAAYQRRKKSVSETGTNKPGNIVSRRLGVSGNNFSCTAGFLQLRDRTPVESVSYFILSTRRVQCESVGAQGVYFMIEYYQAAATVRSPRGQQSQVAWHFQSCAFMRWTCCVWYIVPI